MAKAINSKRKGSAGERELASVLREHGYANAKRGQQYCGYNGDADIVDAIPGIHIECKRVERLNLEAAFDQSVRDAKAGEIPVVMHRRNRRPWMITIRLEDFFRLTGKDGNGRTPTEEGH